MALLEDKLLQQAIHYLNIAHFEQAEVKCKELLAVNPENGYYLYLLARCLFGEKSYKEAGDTFKEALRRGHSSEDCLYFLGRAAANQDKLKEAAQYYNEVLQINPLNAETLAAYGFVLIRTRKKEKGNQLIDRALELEPHNSVILDINFLRCLRIKKHKERMQALDQFFIYSDNETRKLVLAGFAEIYRGNFRAARDNFKQAYILSPTDNYILSLLKDAEYQSKYIFSFGFLYKIFNPVVARLLAVGLMILIWCILRTPSLKPYSLILMIIFIIYLISIKRLSR